MPEKYRWLDIRALGVKAMMRTSAQVVRYFDEERYTDPEGIVWVGFGEAPDEVWVVESGSGEGYMTKEEMTIKMVHEIVEARENNGG